MVEDFVAGFARLVQDQRFIHLPMILETPKGDHEEMDAINLKTLRDLVNKGGLS